MLTLSKMESIILLIYGVTMKKFKNIVLPILIFLVLAYSLTISIIFKIHENKVESLQNELEEGFKLNTYSNADYLIDQDNKVIKYKIDKTYIVKNDDYSAQIESWHLSESYAIFDKFNRNNEPIYKTVNTDNTFCVIRMKVTSLRRKEVPICLGDFDLKLVYGSKYDNDIMLNSQFELLATNETILLDSYLSYNFYVIFEIPKDDYTIGNSPNKFVLINDLMFGHYDKKSDWNFIYELKF